MQLAAVAANLIAWLQLLALDGDLATAAEPKLLRFRMLHVSARLIRGARRRRLHPRRLARGRPRLSKRFARS
jgi:hypothetical protein